MTDTDRDDRLWEAVADPTRKKVLDLLVAGEKPPPPHSPTTYP